MQDAITQSQIVIDQSLAAIASTREAIAFLDRLQARQNSSRHYPTSGGVKARAALLTDQAAGSVKRAQCKSSK
jgi:hypothetical protein